MYFIVSNLTGYWYGKIVRKSGGYEHSWTYTAKTIENIDFSTIKASMRIVDVSIRDLKTNGYTFHYISSKPLSQERLQSEFPELLL